MSLLAKPLDGAETREVAGLQLDIVRTGSARVKRLIYPAGFRWSVNMKPIVGTDYCMHAHVGFLASGSIHVQYADGCTMDVSAPEVLYIEPGHDAWVTGDEPAIVIEFDFERDTVQRLGLPEFHAH